MTRQEFEDFVRKECDATTKYGFNLIQSFEENSDPLDDIEKRYVLVFANEHVAVEITCWERTGTMMVEIRRGREFFSIYQYLMFNHREEEALIMERCKGRPSATNLDRIRTYFSICNKVLNSDLRGILEGKEWHLPFIDRPSLEVSIEGFKELVMNHFPSLKDFGFRLVSEKTRPAVSPVMRREMLTYNLIFTNPFLSVWVTGSSEPDVYAFWLQGHETFFNIDDYLRVHGREAETAQYRIRDDESFLEHAHRRLAFFDRICRNELRPMLEGKTWEKIKTRDYRDE